MVPRVCSDSGLVKLDPDPASTLNSQRKAFSTNDLARQGAPQPGLKQLTRARAEPFIRVLNRQPTLWVVLGATAVFMLLSLIMELYVVSANQHHVVFGAGSYMVFSAYFVVHYYLLKFSTSYKRVPEDKQFYVLSNLIKSGVLLAYCPLAANVLWKTMVQDEWPNQRIRNLGCMYAIPDFVSLLLVRRMGVTTVIHHICVLIFNFISIYNDYGEENVCRLIVVYAVFSTFAYLVNLLLASRFLDISDRGSAVLSALALLIYASCCGMNWTWQVTYSLSLVSRDRSHLRSIVLYAMVIMMVVWDDLVLMAWLYKNARKKWASRFSVGGPAGKRAGGGKRKSAKSKRS